MVPIVLITGFSTAGKSTFLREFSTDINCIDTDRKVADHFQCEHIYEVYMHHGYEKAIKLIEQQENELLNWLIINQDRPTLIAAGPILMLRDNWQRFNEARKPFIIHLSLTAKQAYEGLLYRKTEQKQKLNQDNPNFGSWDKDVTTTLENGRYIDLPPEIAIAKIEGHLIGVTRKYKEHCHHEYDARALQSNPDLKQEMIELIKSRLH
jgi:shikimate kinase